MPLPQEPGFIFSRTPTGAWGVLFVGKTKSIYKSGVEHPVDVLVHRKDGKTATMRLGKFWGAKTEYLDSRYQCNDRESTVRGGLYSATQTPITEPQKK